MLSVRIVCVGKLKEQYYSDAANEYVKRLCGYCKPEVLEVREQRLPMNPSENQITHALEKEHTAIQALLPTGAFTIALCIEGREIDSTQLSDLLTDCANRGASRLCFVIGGSNGLHNLTKVSANMMLSLSKMTFPHNLVRVMLLEQLYRAFSITQGAKYHK